MTPLVERIRAGHAAVIGLAGIEYTVLISIAHLSLDGDVNIKTVADHLHLSGAFITSVAQRLLGRSLQKRNSRLYLESGFSAPLHPIVIRRSWTDSCGA